MKDRPTADDIEAAAAAIALGWEPHPGALVWARVQNFGHEALHHWCDATVQSEAAMAHDPRWFVASRWFSTEVLDLNDLLPRCAE